jgi:hypothetical protein
MIMSNKSIIQKVLKEYTEDELFDYKPNFSAEELIKYIDSEWDIEILKMVGSKISDRVDYLNQVIGMGNRREVKGFRRD